MAWTDDLAAYAQSQLTTRERDALNARGTSDEQIEQFRIGYLNKELPDMMGASEFLMWCHHGAKLADVFVFPLTTMLGAVGGFQFRFVDRAKKGYTDFFQIVDEPVYFGLSQALPHIWASGQAFVVEGVFDLFPIQRHLPYAFATLTAKMPEPLTRVLHRVVDDLWLGYDMDFAGRKACKEFERDHGREFVVHVVNYPKIYRVGSKELIKDPGDLWETWGDARFKQYLQALVE